MKNQPKKQPKKQRLLKPTTVVDRLILVARETAKFMAQQNQKVAEIKSRCAHDWKFSRDASGNNDNYYVCNACDKILSPREYEETLKG